MSVKNIILESIAQNPVGLKEALVEELSARIALALEGKINQLDELSKTTLASYIKKVPQNATMTKFQAIAHTKKTFDGIDVDAHEMMADKLHRRYDNRIKGVTRATDKLMKEEKYNPLKPLKRSISFNDFEEHDGDADYATVKKIKWPYGIDVKFDDKNKTVTFTSAKMKTVAELLDKAIDFGATTAGEVLDLPPELMKAYISPKRGNFSVPRDASR